MKMKDMLALSEMEIQTEIQSANKALFEARFKLSMQQLENTAILRQLRHRIAQLKTVLNTKLKQA